MPATHKVPKSQPRTPCHTHCSSFQLPSGPWRCSPPLSRSHPPAAVKALHQLPSCLHLSLPSISLCLVVEPRLGPIREPSGDLGKLLPAPPPISTEPSQSAGIVV